MRRVNEYLELPARVELLNSRFSVLQEMLDMLRDHQVRLHVLGRTAPGVLAWGGLAGLWEQGAWHVGP